MMERLFDPAEFAKCVRVRRAELHIDQRTAAQQIGISTSTLCRLENERSPSVEVYLRIRSWLGTGKEVSGEAE